MRRTPRIMMASLAVITALSATAVAQPPPDAPAQRWAGPCVMESDAGMDGVVDYRVTITYHLGRVVAEEHDRGNSQRRVAYTYDEGGRLITEEEDTSGDRSGNTSRLQTSSSPDGIPDRRTTYTYDAQGNLIAREWDEQADGSPDGYTTYSYDERGNLSTEEEDMGVDGEVDSRTIYTYDDQGHRLSTAVDYDLDGASDDLDTFRYDAQGNLSVHEVAVSEGEVVERTTRTYDERGQLSTEIVDADADGTTDSVITYTYDQWGNLVTREVGTADGDALERTTYTYGCWL